MKEISGTKLLISLHHSSEKCAALEVFDLAKKGRPEKIYSFDEVIGCNSSLQIIRLSFFFTNSFFNINTNSNYYLLQ